MYRRIPLTAGAIGGGVLAAAVSATAVAVADPEGGGAGLGDAAVTAGDYTFDPVESGADYSLDLGPLLQSGTADHQVEVYDEDGGQLGSFTSADDDVATVFGITDTDFTFDADTFDAADGADAADLPADDTEYHVTDVGLGIQNVYESAPSDHGGSADVNDTLVTPLGELDLSPLFNPTAIFSDFHGLLDGLFGADEDELFGDDDDGSDGGSDDGGSNDVSSGDIESALNDAGITDGSFEGGDQDVGNLADGLADTDLDLGSGDVTGDDVIEALQNSEVAADNDLTDDLDIESNDTGADHFGDVDFSPGDVADAIDGLF